MKRSIQHLLALVAVLGLCIGASAQQPRKLRVDFKDTKLKNGLRVITVEDHSAPVVSFCVTYNSGSRNERKGRTGFAHLFEHMMFKGSENVGTGEHFYLIFNNGGNMNGTTSEDRTNYFETLPANQLELGIFLEADRMRSLEVTKENLDNQRTTVKEERRQGVDNQPYGKSGELLQEMIYENFAYKHTVIGSMEDLSAATVEDVKDFFRIYYAPNNAVLTLVGDFKTADALALVRKYFESIPSQPAPPPVDMTEPEQKTEKRAVVDDQMARTTRVDIAFKTVAGNTPDYYALSVLSTALNSGQSSRLFQKLVKEKQLVQSVGGYSGESRGPGAFQITAMLLEGKKTEEIETAIYEEIEKLKKEPIQDWELQKAKNNARRSFINSLQASLYRAISLGQYTVFYDDPNLINTRLDKISAVTKEDVMRVANKYLASSNRVVVITNPKAKGAAATAAGK